MLPGIGAYHPIIVHFVVALLIVGVVLRLVSLTGRLAFTNAAATTLIVLGTLASFAAVKSGEDAHGPVERVPGARAAVVEHEEWGERARNVFVVVSLLELAVLALRSRQQRYARGAAVAAGVVGLVGAFVLYEAASHGGALVYEHAGGVGLRTGNPADVNRLFIAGVYHQAVQDRQAGRGTQGADLVDMAAARFPDDLELQLLSIEWTTDVRRDPDAALARLDALRIPQEGARLRTRAGLARAAALRAQGNVDGARAVLQTLLAEFPENRQVQQRLAELDAR
ncbi:MAG: tetratricopeptide repeat protein [Vicinamibacteraceae bacterium]|nr:tetratricopeptide repeat protein [Vicinamibacteraceae bacterium]